MNTRRRIWIASASLVVSFGLVSAVVCRAQPAPDPSLWSPFFNPSGQRVVPVVFYDSTTGILGLDTRGLNRMDDTPDYTTIPGPIGVDDVGLGAFRIQTEIMGGEWLSPFSLGFDATQHLVWFTNYSGQRYVLVGAPAPNLFLWPSVYATIQLPTGLTSNDFGEVEMSVTVDAISPTGFLFAGHGVQVVPEPSIEFLLIATTLGLFCRAKMPFKKYLARVFQETTVQCLPK